MTNNNDQTGGLSKRKTYTVPEVAEILGISRRSAYHFCERARDFKVMRLGKSLRVHRESFDAWFGHI